MKPHRVFRFSVLAAAAIAAAEAAAADFPAGAMDGLTARLVMKVKGYETTETTSGGDPALLVLASTKQQTRALSNPCYVRFQYAQAPQTVGSVTYDQGLYYVWTACFVDSSWVVVHQEQLIFYEQQDATAIAYNGLIHLDGLTEGPGAVDEILWEGTAFAKPTGQGGKIGFLPGVGFVAIDDDTNHFIDGPTKMIAKTVASSKLPEGLDAAFDAAMGP